MQPPARPAIASCESVEMNDRSPDLRVLVVEDDERMLDLLCRGLRQIGYTVMPAPDGPIGLDLALKFEFDAVVLDIGLPGRDGYEVTHALREQKKAIPILMLTARDAEDDIIRGLDTGADDYLIKPFSFPELVARIHRLTTSVPRKGTGVPLVLDHARLAVIREHTVISLTRSEFLLLAALIDHAGAATTRQQLMEAIWGREQQVSPNTLDVLVNALRVKLDAPYTKKLIVTVRRIGYRLDWESGSQQSTSLRQATAPA
jgi:DNA-binding response OmpR family regulator